VEAYETVHHQPMHSSRMSGALPAWIKSLHDIRTRVRSFCVVEEPCWCVRITINPRFRIILQLVTKHELRGNSIPLPVLASAVGLLQISSTGIIGRIFIM